MGLEISIRESRDIAILDLAGKLITGEEASLLSKQLHELIGNGKNKLLLNLRNLKHIDSSGVSIIARTHSSLKCQGGNLGLVSPGGHVLDVFRVLHLLEVIPKFEDEAQATASFRSLRSLPSLKAHEGATLLG